MRWRFYSGAAHDSVPATDQLLSCAIISATQFTSSAFKVFRSDPERLADPRRNPKGCESESGLRRDIGSAAHNLSFRLHMAIRRRWHAGMRWNSGHRSIASGETERSC